MPQNIIQYNLLISCPGDIKDEIDIINRTVQKFNDQFSDTLGISIRTRHWSKNSYPQSGGKPQALLNEQFVKQCDAAVVLFWTRFGTATDEYGSGTEEELEIMLDAGKQVFLYFSEKPISPSQMDTEGYKKVQTLKEKYQERGIYFGYSSNEEFEKLFYAHLTMYFLHLKASADAQSERKSELALRGIDADGYLCENPAALLFKPNRSKDTKTRLAEINELYEKINLIHVGHRLSIEEDKKEENKNSQSLLETLTQTAISVNSSFFPPVIVDQQARDRIETFAKTFKISMSDDFFCLGNLVKDIANSSFIGGGVYKGTRDENLKYDLITKLDESISDLGSWSEFENAYDELTCICLAIENSGTAVDEDIEVTLQFNREVLLPLDKLLVIRDEQTLKYVLDDCDLEDLFSIGSTVQYKAYEESQETGSYTGASQALNEFNPLLGRDYLEEYREHIQNVYCYEIFEEKDQYVMKVKFDYVKHHTVIAFPSPIFLQKVPNEIEYTITSRNYPDIISGKLLVKTN